MELLLISFVAAWILRAWWDGRRADYSNPDNQYRQCALAGRSGSSQRRSGRDLRYAAGWSAYQLRHGGPAMWGDVRQGWDDARQGYEDWRSDRGDDRPSVWDTARTAWKKARRALPQRGTDQPPIDVIELTQPEDQQPTRTPYVPVPKTWINPNGGTMTPTGEATGISQYRDHLTATIDAANQRIDEANTEIGTAEKEIASHESVNAQLREQGLGDQTAGDMADLMETSQQRKAAAEQRLAAAEASKAQAEQALAKLDSQGHTAIEETVKGAAAPVAKTSFYEN